MYHQQTTSKWMLSTNLFVGNDIKHCIDFICCLHLRDYRVRSDAGIWCHHYMHGLHQQLCILRHTTNPGIDKISNEVCILKKILGHSHEKFAGAYKNPFFKTDQGTWCSSDTQIYIGFEIFAAEYSILYFDIFSTYHWECTSPLFSNTSLI